MDDWLAAARRQHEYVEPFADAFLDGFLLLFLAYLWFMKGLLLGRSTPLGLWLARSKIAQSFTVLGAFFAMWFAVFAADLWRYSWRAIVAYCCAWVLIHLKRSFGGWVSMHKRAFWSGVAWLRRQPEPNHEDLMR